MTVTAPLAFPGLGYDRRSRLLTGPRALAIVIALYLLTFGPGIASSVADIGGGSGPIDLASVRGVGIVVRLSAEILFVLVFFNVITRWLYIPRPLAGVPRARREIIGLGDRPRLRPSPLPAAFTAVGATLSMIISFVLPTLFETEPVGDVDQGGLAALADNLFTQVGGVIASINAGVVEEIVIVVVPVLLLLRVGWHPVAVVALSTVMRLPFHLYHGWAVTLSFAVWAAAFCTMFLLWRRLWPLVIVHALNDLTIQFGQSSRVLAGLLLAVFVIWAAAGPHEKLRSRTTTLTDGRRITYVRLAPGSVRIYGEALANGADPLPAVAATRAAIGMPTRILVPSSKKNGAALEQLGFRSALGVFAIPADADLPDSSSDVPADPSRSSTTSPPAPMER